MKAGRWPEPGSLGVVLTLMSVGEMAFYELEELVIELALLLHRLRDKPSLRFEGSGLHALEGSVPLFHLAPQFCEVVPVLLDEVAIELLEEPVFELALTLEQIHDPP